MKFELGKAYQHAAGRRIFIAGAADTQTWGKVLVAEEKDHTGVAISCVQLDADHIDDNWREIGIDEWKTA